VVVRDEVFKEYDIQRNNAARVANEHQAREQRKVAPVRDNRRDAQQPAFSAPRAYPSKIGDGGGAMGPWALVLLLPLLLASKRKRLF
jgi:Ca-activated chloride channel family protein